MKILITGANGELGSDLVSYFIKKKNYKIFANYRGSKKKINKFKNVSFLRHDFSNEIKKKLKVDVIVNCIAAHNFSKKKKIMDLIDSNIYSIRNLIQFAKKSQVKLFVNLSTISIYGKVIKTKLKEDYKPKNQDNLGFTKYSGELLLFNSSINFINLRLPGVLTKSRNFKRPWLKTIIWAIKNNKNIKLYNHNKKFNNVIDTYEIFKFLDFILNKKFVNKNHQLNLNLSASQPIQISALTKFIKKFYNSNSGVVFKKKTLQATIFL